MSVVLTILERQLRHSEALLSELDSALAKEAELAVHLALTNVQVLVRLEERKHVLGDRP